MISLDALSLLEWEEFLNRYSDRRFHIVDHGMSGLEMVEIIDTKPVCLISLVSPKDMIMWIRRNLIIDLKHE